MQTLITIVLVTIFSIVYIAGFYALKRWSSKIYPKSVLRRGRQNALITAAGLLVVWGLPTTVVWVISKESFSFSALVTFGVLWIVMSVGTFIGWFSNRKAAGHLLLDCGPQPTKIFSIGYAIVIALICGGEGIFLLAIESYIVGGAIIVVGIPFVIFMLAFAFGHLQLRENGIWVYMGLLKWESLLSWEWDGNSLLYTTKKRNFLLNKGALVVPHEYRTAFDEGLMKHITN